MRGIPRTIRRYPGLVKAWLARYGRRRRYDPEPEPARRRIRRPRLFRRATGYVRRKPYVVGARGGVAWVGPKRLRYDPDPGVPRGWRRPLRWLAPLAGIASYIYANVKKDATSLNDVPSKLVEHHTKPMDYFPKSVGEYWERLKGNPVFWAGIAGWIYSVLPIRRLPARRTVGNIGKAATVGTALGAVLDPTPKLERPVTAGVYNNSAEVRPMIVAGDRVIKG